MATASPQYTLVGFSPVLDWRPLTFIKPVPTNRVCSACGLVRKSTALLPCMHTLCDCCYEQCCQHGSHDCPLDGHGFEKDDVTLMDYPADELLKREVKCWNEGSGCQYSTAASGIAEHLQRECEHHSVRCPKCSAIVLCRDVCLHLKSTSCNTSRHLPPESRGALVHTDETASVISLKRAFERQAGEITAYLRPMAVDISTHSDRVNEISHSVNTMKETMRQELASLTRETQDIVMKSITEIASSNAELKERLATCSDTANTCLTTVTNLEKTLNDKFSGTRSDLSEIKTVIEQVKVEGKESAEKTFQLARSVVTRNLLELTKCEFLVKGVKALEEEVTKMGWAQYDSEKVYLLGHCMSPGVSLENTGTGTSLYVCYTLCKGDLDDAVRWPFQHNVIFCIIHPRGGGDVVLVGNANPWVSCNKGLALVSRNQRGCSIEKVPLDSLMNEGYVADDQLRIKLELKP